MLVIINGLAEKQTCVHVSMGGPQYGKNIVVVRAALTEEISSPTEIPGMKVKTGSGMGRGIASGTVENS
jgi:hypothetical protein